MPVYLAFLAFGGVALVASLFGGGHGGDGHGGGEGSTGGDAPGGDANAEGDGHAARDGGAGGHALQGAMAPFLSLRFWTFALAFFGLTGTLLTVLGAASASIVPLVSGVVGVGTGYTASRVLHGLAGRPVGLLPAAGSHVGREGRLLLPAGAGQRGKVRFEAGGTQVDLVAECDGDDTLPAGTPVLVVGLRGTVAVVERSPTPAALPSEKEIP